MTEAVIIALISTLGTILVALLGLLGKVVFDLAKVKEQTTNSHDTNLRDDLTHVKDAVTRIETTQGELIESDKAQWKAIKQMAPR